MFAARRRRFLALVLTLAFGAAGSRGRSTPEHFAHQARDLAGSFDGDFMTRILEDFDANIVLTESFLDVGRDFVGDDDGVIFAQDDVDLFVFHAADAVVDVLADLLPALVLAVDRGVTDRGDEGFDKAAVVLDLPVDDVASCAVGDALEEILMADLASVVGHGADQ